MRIMIDTGDMRIMIDTGDMGYEDYDWYSCSAKSVYLW